MIIKSTLNIYSFTVCVQLLTRISQTIKLDHKRIKKAKSVSVTLFISKISNKLFDIAFTNISEIKKMSKKRMDLEVRNSEIRTIYRFLKVFFVRNQESELAKRRYH